MPLQGGVLAETAHRPWPLPRRPWVMGQTWLDLAFLHWRVPAETLRRAVPDRLALDEWDGSAWLGVTPFEVARLHPRWVPPLPGISRFPEINVRTYVTVGGKPGIWFFSLDAATRSAVATARRVYRVPYFRARMAIDRSGGEIAFRSERVPEEEGPPASFAGRYRPLEPPRPAPPGSLEHFLTERYCLYTLDAEGRPLRGEIHHPPWPLQPASAVLERNTMATEVGLGELPGEPLVHYSARQDVVFWLLERA